MQKSFNKIWTKMRNINYGKSLYTVNILLYIKRTSGQFDNRTKNFEKYDRVLVLMYTCKFESMLLFGEQKFEKDNTRKVKIRTSGVIF